MGAVHPRGRDPPRHQRQRFHLSHQDHVEGRGRAVGLRRRQRHADPDAEQVRARVRVAAQCGRPHHPPGAGPAHPHQAQRILRPPHGRVADVRRQDLHRAAERRGRVEQEHAGERRTPLHPRQDRREPDQAAEARPQGRAPREAAGADEHRERDDRDRRHGGGAPRVHRRGDGLRAGRHHGRPRHLRRVLRAVRARRRRGQQNLRQPVGG